MSPAWTWVPVPVDIGAMLQATIQSAWEDYEGDRQDPVEFWDFLIGTGDKNRSCGCGGTGTHGVDHED